MSVRLSSSDNQEFVVRKEIAEQSVFIENMICDGGVDTPVFLPNVTAKVLQKVIEWCDHHCARTDEQRTTLDDWDKAFLLEDQEMLFDLVTAANYLEIKPLLNAGCTAVSEMIKAKSAKEIRTIFNIVNDFTPEEEALIRKENEWKEDPPV